MWFYNKLYNLRQAGSAEASEELFSLASGSSNLVSSYTGCIVNGVRFLCYDRDKNLKTQNSGVLVPGVDNKNFYGQLEEVIVMSYLAGCSVVLFKCKWFDTDPTKSRMKHENNITSIFTKFEWYKDDKFILATQAKQIFYLDDLKNDRDWKIVEEVHHRNVWDTPAADEQLDPIEIDVMHDTISSDFQLFVDLGPLPEINFCRRDQPPSIVNVDTPVDQEEDEEEEEEEMVDEEEEEEMDLEEDNVEENENDSDNDNEYYSDD